VVDVERWAEVRRMHRVEGLSGREIQPADGVASGYGREVVGGGCAAAVSVEGGGVEARSVQGLVCEQLRADPRIQSQRLREMAGEIGYQGRKSIFDDYVRETRAAVCSAENVSADDLSAG
jgi:hypothetical protein